MREEKIIHGYKVILDLGMVSIRNRKDHVIAEFSLPEGLTVKDIHKTSVVIKNDNNSLLGVYDFYGHEIVPVKYNYIVFYDIGIIVREDSKSGLYSYSGTILISVKHSVLAPCCNGTNKVIVSDEVRIGNKIKSLSGVYEVESESSELIVPVEFTKVIVSDTGLIKVQKEEDGPFEPYVHAWISKTNFY